MENVNWLSLVLATLLPTIMGFIYYNPNVFGRAWMASIGMTEEKAKEANMAVMMIVGLIMSLFIAFFLMNNVNSPGQEGEFDTFKHGAFHGVLISVMIGIPILVTNGLYEQKSFKNLAINAGYWIITFALMGGVLDAMNSWPNS